MTTLTYVPSRVGEGFFTDFQSPASGATDNGKAWLWNSATGKFEPQALNFDPAGTAAAAVAAHAAASDPHSGYLLASGARAGAVSGRQVFTNGISTPTQTGLIAVGTYGTISETAGGLAYITGNALKASLTANNGIVKTAGDAGQFIRMRYDQGISFHTNLTGAAGTEYADTANLRMRIDLYGFVGIGTNLSNPSALLDIAGSTAERSSLTIRQGVAPSAPNSGDIWNDGAFVLATSNSGTNAVFDSLKLRRDSTGTPAAGFGLGIAARLGSSTTEDRDAGRLTWEWVTATDASRASRGKLSAYYTTTEQEAMRWDGDSGGLKLGFYGQTAVARQTLATGASATVDDVITALQALGLVKQS